MRISGWSIDGFGVFQNYEVRDLPAGLTVFHGANEAGKSTLLAFLRAMLFGFPDRRAAQSRYAPVNGGRHGGRLHLDLGDRSLIIDRDASRRSLFHIERSDGCGGSLQDLEVALAGADEQLFRSIFAFSLTELQTFESLTVDGIRDRIFTAGVAGAGRSARAVIDALDGRARQLLRRSGRARIATLAAELQRVREALDAARVAAVQYRDRLEEEETCQEATRRLADELVGARREQERYSALLDLWPTWCALRDAQQERAALAPVAALPVDAEIRLATLNEALRVAQRSLEALDADLSAHHAALERVQSIRDPYVDLAAVEPIHAELPLRRDRARALDATHERLAAVDADFGTRLAQLGHGWDEARFATFAAQQPAVDEVRFWEQQLVTTDAARGRATVEHQRAQQRVQDVSAERDRMRARLPVPPPPSRELLKERDGAVRRLRSHIVELRAVQSDAEASDRVVSDGTQAMRAFEAAAVRLRPAWITIALCAALMAGTGLGVWREELGDRPGALIAAGVTAAAVVALALLRRWAGTRDAQRRAHVATLVAEIEQAMQARDGYRAQAAVLRTEIYADRDALEIETLSFDSIDEEDRRLQQQRAERARWDEISAHVAQIESVLQAAQRAAAAAADQRAMAERAWADAEQGWDEWLRPCGLSGAGTPSEVTALLGSIATCREVWAQREELRADAAGLQLDLSAWEARALELVRSAASLGGEPAAVGEAHRTGECFAQVAALHERWLVERERRETERGLLQEIATQRARLAELELERAGSDGARRRLFEEIGAGDEAEFLRRIAEYRRAADLERFVADGERQIVARVGVSDAEATRLSLASEAVAAWEMQRAAGAERIAALETQRDEAVRHHHDARRLRRELEDSAAVATLESEYEGLRAELDSAINEWRVTTGARALIEETLRDFERSRQPAVLAAAGRVLEIVTQGRYARVVQDDDQIVVIDPSGARKGPAELSRGTLEQLYLCVRLGLAAEFGRRSASLPLIMDDVLVNFDPERARALAVALAEMAHAHQILFFTCQPATRDILVDAGRAARVVEMGAHESASCRVDQLQPAP